MSIRMEIETVREEKIRDREGTGLSRGIRYRISGGNGTVSPEITVPYPLAIWSVPPRVPKMAHQRAQASLSPLDFDHPCGG
jgi:hypothetical protein